MQMTSHTAQKSGLQRLHLHFSKLPQEKNNPPHLPRVLCSFSAKSCVQNSLFPLDRFIQQSWSCTRDIIAFIIYLTGRGPEIISLSLIAS